MSSLAEKPRVTSWEQFDRLVEQGKPIPPLDIRSPRRVIPGAVTSWEEFDQLNAAGLPVPSIDIDNRETKLREEVFENIKGPNGEIFRTREDYLRFEVNDVLRMVHENAVADHTTSPVRIPNRSKPKGLLAAIAVMDRSPVSLPEISAWNEILPSSFDNWKRATRVLVEEGFLVAHSDRYGGEHPAYALAASSLDSLEVINRMVEENARPKKDKSPRRKFFGRNR